MRKIERQNDDIVVALSDDDIDLIITSLRETLEALEDWEFETRTGFKRGEIERFLEQVQSLAKHDT
ncbi:hypothetical protein [Sorangium sp. So ce513]|uniref:hypothetical protein n=1 Tax=Sorangium sp. So ce513 TaxID=3133315 RepID=UPI003F624552